MRSIGLGDTGLRVTPLGFGAGHVGDPTLPEEDAAALLHGVLDEGIGLIDVAPSYGLAEERIGRHLSARRSAFVLATKCGYGVPGVPDWTPACITRGVDLALERLRTEVIDVMFLHSCPAEVLRSSGVVEALVRAVEQGKVRAAGYSGEGEALEVALASGAFAVVQTSVSFLDQRGIDGAVAQAPAVIAKRPLANAPWRFAHRPEAPDLATYFDRFHAARPEARGLPWPELALRFVLSVPRVSSCLAGTRDLSHLRELVRAAEAGPLPEEHYRVLRETFRAADAGWGGVI